MQYKPESDGPSTTGNGIGTRVNERVPSKLSGSLSRNDESTDNSVENSEHWDDLQTFTGLLEKFEAWIFSRIVESVWWQVISPYSIPPNDVTSFATIMRLFLLFLAPEDKMRETCLRWFGDVERRHIDLTLRKISGTSMGRGRPKRN